MKKQIIALAVGIVLSWFIMALIFGFCLGSQANRIEKLSREIELLKNRNYSSQTNQFSELHIRNEMEAYVKISNAMQHAKDESLILGVNETSPMKEPALVTKRNIDYLCNVKNSNLQYLYFWNNQLENNDLENLFKAPWFNQLKALEVNGNMLTDEFIDALVEKKHPNLVWLNFADNQITKEGVFKLIDNAHMLPRLKYINYRKFFYNLVSSSIDDVFQVHFKVKEMLPNIQFEKGEV